MRVSDCTRQHSGTRRVSLNDPAARGRLRALGEDGGCPGSGCDDRPNTLPTALHVRIDDYLEPRCSTGRPPKLTDAELLTLALAQALLGVHSEQRWLRLIPQRLPG